MKDKNDFRYLIPIGTGLLAWSVALRLFATAKTLTMILYIGLFILGVVCIVAFFAVGFRDKTATNQIQKNPFSP